MFRAGVDPLRCAFPASRKPRAYIPVCPFDVCVSPLGPADKTCDACAVLHRCKPGFTIPGEPARRMRRALFCTPRHMTSRAHLETRRDGLGRLMREMGRAAGGPESIPVRDSFLLEASHRVHIDVLSGAISILALWLIYSFYVIWRNPERRRSQLIKIGYWALAVAVVGWIERVLVHWVVGREEKNRHSIYKEYGQSEAKRLKSILNSKIDEAPHPSGRPNGRLATMTSPLKSVFARNPRGESGLRACYARLTRRCRASARTDEQPGQTKNARDAAYAEFVRAVEVAFAGRLNGPCVNFG
jgi:hypothetical protein